MIISWLEPLSPLGTDVMPNGLAGDS